MLKCKKNVARADACRGRDGLDGRLLEPVVVKQAQGVFGQLTARLQTLLLTLAHLP